jgi:hypothetical protein
MRKITVFDIATLLVVSCLLVLGYGDEYFSGLLDSISPSREPLYTVYYSLHSMSGGVDASVSMMLSIVAVIIYTAFKLIKGVFFVYSVMLGSILFLGWHYNTPVREGIDLFTAALILVIPQAVNLFIFLIFGEKSIKPSSRSYSLSDWS